MASRNSEGITEGGLARPLFHLAWPIVVTQLLQVAYNVADAFWLGRYSADAVGAISLAFPLIFFLIAFGGGFNVAGSTLVAQYTGADSDGSAGKVAGQTLGFVVCIGVVLAVVGRFSAGPMLSVFPSDPATAERVVPLAQSYLEIFFLGLPFMFGFLAFSALLRGYGDTRTPMRVMALSVALNVVLDPILIFGVGPFAEMGIEGAAWATLVARAAGGVLGVAILFGTDMGPDVSVGHLAPDLSYVRDIVRIGTPAALEQSAGALAMVMLTVMIVTFEPAVIAAYGLGNRLISLVFLPAVGLGKATNTMVGQNLGAGNPARAEQAVTLAAKAGAGVMFALAVLAALFPEPIVSVFMATDTADAAATIGYASEYLRIRTVEFAFIGVFQVLVGAYRGAGNTKTAMVLSMVTLWIIRVPVVYLLAFETSLGATGIWVGVALGHVVGALAAAAWFTRGTWKEAVVDAGPSDPAVEVDGVAED
ncbi:MATE family efflux transporter [Halorussus salilacus]|uniref:MATE family efflux transporter n=1 Tax=Halorussus salilacus TaxID=2953750 RepID=UPI00209D841A|nr:MATE family efflux transporter [Halorussus salilacus]USZ69413.1 MATE family efflux transporter [Halorussus salilacus]